MVGEVRVGEGDGFAPSEILGLQSLAIRGEDELGTDFCSGGADLQRLERFAYGADFAHGDVDVVTLKHAMGGTSDAILMPVRRRFRAVSLIAESGQERKRELRRVEGLKGQFRNGFFDFDCIHGASCLCDFPPLVSGRGSVIDAALRGSIVNGCL